MNVKSATAALLCVFVLAVTGPWASPAGAQQPYPSHTVKIIAGYPPGGGTDTQARLMAEKLSQVWGQPVVVDNQPGGLGIISARAVATAPPDGYTLYMGTFDHLVLVYSLKDDVPFDTQRDFIPISPVADQGVVIATNPSVPVSSVQELVALARERPNRLTYASVGVGSISHLAAELFQIRNGIKMVHVPYKGSAPALADLMSGQGGQVMFASLATVAPQIKAGRVKALAVTGKARSPLLPDVPTTDEAGLPDFVMSTWNGLFLPAGTPKEIVNAVSSATLKVLDMSDVRDKLLSLGFEPSRTTPEGFARIIASDLQRWQKIIADANIPKQ